MAKTRARSGFRPKLIALAVASCFTAGTAMANPTGANVVHGTAAIHQAGNLLQITNSPNAIINWQSFSIGANEITRFIQQSSSSAVLNRVTTQNPSTILGALQSNGRVFLINPNGILFGAGAQIDVGGLIASTLNMSDQDFLAGRMRFTDGLGKSVVNDGSITTGAGGSVYLIGSGVTNNGIITSPSGEVVLAAGNSVELVSPGTPNLRVEIAALDNEARNLGQIISDAGRIGIYAGLINNSGTIRADSAVSEGGRILLKATKSATLEAGSVTSASGPNGGSVTIQSGDTTLVSGTLEAKGTEGSGGTIQVLGNLIGLIDGASIDASGETGGGTVLIGGDFQGKNPDIQNAFRTYVGPDTTIKADAVTSGDGGKVIVWADDITRFYGNISARGGAQSGDGGFAEVSSKWLDFNASVDTRAPNGVSGTLLLDPTSIWIAVDQASATAAGMAGTDASANNSTSPFFAALGAVSDSLLTTSVLNAALDGSGFVSVSTFNSLGAGAGNITVVDTVSWTSAATLQLSADGSIDLRAPLNGPNGSVHLFAVNGIGQTVAGAITTNELYASGGSGSVLLNVADNRVNILAGNATGQFFFRNAQNLTIGTIITAEASGIQVNNTNGPATVNVEVTSGNLTVNGSVTATASGSNQAAMITLAAAGGIMVNNTNVTATGGSGADSGGAATVLIIANTGGIEVTNSTVRATGGGALCCSGGGSANVTLSAPGGITVQNNSFIVSTGGNGFDSFSGFGSGLGGNAAVSLTSSSGPIAVSSSTVSASGGNAGASGGGGGNASVNVTGGSITVSSSNVGALGGSGFNGANGGDASVSLNTGGGIAVNGTSIVAAQGGFGSPNGGTGSVALNAGAAGITVQSSGLICRFCEVLVSEVTTTAVSGVVGPGVSAIGGDGVNTGGAATVALNTTGGITLDNTTVGGVGGSGGIAGGAATAVLSATGGITLNTATAGAFGGNAAQTGTGGNAQTTLTTGGNIALASNVIADGGSGFLSDGTGRIDLIFLNSSGTFSVNGVTDLIFDAGSGFLVDGAPAILNTNLFVTQGVQVFIDPLVAAMNQQIDVLADQLRAGETGEGEDEEKKLPFCSG